MATPLCRNSSAVSRRAISRRTVLKSAAGTLAAAGSFAWGRAPAFAQQRNIHFLLQSNFQPLFDVEVRKLAAEYKSAAGVEVTTEFISNNDVTARLTAAIESQQGADLSVVQWNQAYLFAGGLIDVGDIVAAAGGDKIYATLRGAVRVDGVYRAYPWYLICAGLNFNKSLCERAGVTKFPETFDELLAAGKKMKQAGTPVGWCLGHTNGDGATNNYPTFWSFGAMEVDDKGRVAINSKEARMAVEWMRQFWADACDESGMGWNDASNNQAFLARQIACAYNPSSIYFKARADAKAARGKGDAETAALWDGLANNIRHTAGPAGPAGRHHLNLPYSIAIFRYSKNQEAAKDFLRWLVAKPQYERCFIAGQGYNQGNTPEWEKHPLWDADPIIAPFAHIPQYGRNLGYKGRSTARPRRCRASTSSPTPWPAASRKMRTLRSGGRSRRCGRRTRGPSGSSCPTVQVDRLAAFFRFKGRGSY